MTRGPLQIGLRLGLSPVGLFAGRSSRHYLVALVSQRFLSSFHRVSGLSAYLSASSHQIVTALPDLTCNQYAGLSS